VCVRLKEVAGSWLPDEIVNRPKGLFSAPLRAWVRNDLKEMVDDMLVGGELVSAGILDGGVIEDLIAVDRRGVEDKSKEIWQLLTLETWFRQADSPARRVGPD
jgi:asparagine synthase (glutamine-hydrolysing)